MAVINVIGLLVVPCGFCQYWFRQSLGAVIQQAIALTNDLSIMTHLLRINFRANIQDTNLKNV